eukprot:scaffold16304_cov117-Isochrysis_galbana.AAC.3
MLSPYCAPPKLFVRCVKHWRKRWCDSKAGDGKPPQALPGWGCGRAVAGSCRTSLYLPAAARAMA